MQDFFASTVSGHCWFFRPGARSRQLLNVSKHSISFDGPAWICDGPVISHPLPATHQEMIHNAAMVCNGHVVHACRHHDHSYRLLQMVRDVASARNPRPTRNAMTMKMMMMMMMMMMIIIIIIIITNSTNSKNTSRVWLSSELSFFEIWGGEQTQCVHKLDSFHWWLSAFWFKVNLLLKYRPED